MNPIAGKIPPHVKTVKQHAIHILEGMLEMLHEQDEQRMEEQVALFLHSTTAAHGALEITADHVKAQLTTVPGLDPHDWKTSCEEHSRVEQRASGGGDIALRPWRPAAKTEPETA